MRDSERDRRIAAAASELERDLREMGLGEHADELLAVMARRGHMPSAVKAEQVTEKPHLLPESSHFKKEKSQ